MGHTLKKNTSHIYNVEQKKPNTKEYIPYCMVSIIQVSKIPLKEIRITVIFFEEDYYERGFQNGGNVPDREICMLPGSITL